MSQLVSILTLIFALGAGILLGRIPAVKAFSQTRPFLALRTIVLYVLIFTMGFRIGRTDEVVSSFPTLGLTALGFSIGTLAGTLAALSALFALTRSIRRGRIPQGEGAEHGRGAGASALHALKDPLTLLVILVGGFFTGLLVPLFPLWKGAALITVVLYALLIVIGIGLGGSGIDIREIATHPDLIILPVGTVIGSLAGGLLAGLLFRMRVGTSLALSSGFGWYSLSGVILTRLDGPLTGSIAFLSNMLRESMALLLIPLLSRTRFPYLAIGAGGATSMDVTLPLIEKSCGPRSVGFAIASGGILSLLVPILVPLLYQIGG